MISTAIKGTDTASGIDLTQLSSAGKSGGASFQKIMSKSLSSNVNNKASQNMVQTKTASGMKSTSTQQNTKHYPHRTIQQLLPQRKRLTTPGLRYLTTVTS